MLCAQLSKPALICQNYFKVQTKILTLPRSKTSPAEGVEFWETDAAMQQFSCGTLLAFSLLASIILAVQQHYFISRN